MIDEVNIHVRFISLCYVTSEETLVVHIIVVIVKINRIEQKEYALSKVEIMNIKTTPEMLVVLHCDYMIC